MNSIEGKIIELLPQRYPRYASRDVASENRQRSYRRTIKDTARVVGATTEDVVRGNPDHVEHAKFDDVDNVDNGPSTLRISEFLAQLKSLPLGLPFVVKDLTTSRGRNKYLIEDPDQLFAFVAWAVEYGDQFEHTVVCQAYVESPSEACTSVRVVTTWDGRPITSSLSYGPDKDNNYVSASPGKGTSKGLKALAEIGGDYFGRTRAFQSNAHYAGGKTIVDTGAKGDEAFLQGERSTYRLATDAVIGDTRDELMKIGGIIILGEGRSIKELDEREIAILEAHGIDPETRVLDKYYEEAAAKIAAARCVTGDRIHELYLGVDFVGENPLESNSRPTPYDRMIQMALKTREDAERNRIRFAIMQNAA